MHLDLDLIIRELKKERRRLDIAISTVEKLPNASRRERKPGTVKSAGVEEEFSHVSGHDRNQT